MSKHSQSIDNVDVKYLIFNIYNIFLNLILHTLCEKQNYNWKEN